MGIFDYCIARKRSVILFMVLILLYGILAYIKIPKEGNPDVKIPIIYIMVNQEGINPEDAKTMILQPLEKGLQGLKGIKEMTGYAYEGAAAIKLEFRAGIDPDLALNEVRNKVNDTKYKLPKAADTPIVKQVDLSLIPVLNLVLVADLPQKDLLFLARKTRDWLVKIPSISEINISGNNQEEIKITLNPNIMTRHKIAIENLERIIKANNMMVTTGVLQKSDGEIAIKMSGLIQNYSELLDFPVYSSEGRVLQLRDLATVTRSFKDPTLISRVNGRPAIVLEISKRAGANIINTVQEVKTTVEAMQKFWPKGVEILYANDNSDKILDMVDELENGIIFAALLVLVIIILAVGVRSALLILLSLPISFFACILILELLGFSLNVVVLFSLILAVGMVVDDAIVVTEYADRRLMAGATPANAYLESAKRMFVPIFTATLVKVVVFLPFLFWPGTLGQFMKYMPITVLIIMTNSLIFALLFQPAIGSLLIVKPPMLERPKVLFISLWYKKFLTKLLKHPWYGVGSLFGLMIVTVILFIKYSAGVEFFPNVEPDNASIVIKSPGNLSLFQKSEIMRVIEKKLEPFKNDVRVFYTKVGAVDNSRQLSEETIGLINLEFSNWKLRQPATEVVEKMLLEISNIPGIIAQSNIIRPGPVAGQPIQINISGLYYDQVQNFANTIQNTMKNDIGGFININNSLPTPGLQWQVIFNKNLAAKYLLTVNDLGNLLQMTTNGLKISTIRLPDLDYELDVRIKFPDKYRNLKELNQLRIVNSLYQVIPINLFTNYKAQPKVSQIKRVDKEDVVTIAADVEKGILPDNKLRELDNWLSNNQPEGITVTFKGDKQDQIETGSFLKKAFIFTLILTFMIMLTQFNNFYDAFVVMTAVFLSITGVLLGLLITGRPFGVVMCGIGIIALAGIVLNNNILMVDTFYHSKENHSDICEAIIFAATERAKPIILTATTAVLGLLPMASKITINFLERNITYGAPSTQWWTQLATTIAGGLTFATTLTLFFTPCLLAIRYNKKRRK
jgi:multidrug efflux pump